MEETKETKNSFREILKDNELKEFFDNFLQHYERIYKEKVSEIFYVRDGFDPQVFFDTENKFIN